MECVSLHPFQLSQHCKYLYAGSLPCLSIGLYIHDVHDVHAHPHVHAQDDITLDNYDEVLKSLSGAVRGAAICGSKQTTSNLAITAAVFARSAALINTPNIIGDGVRSLLPCLLVGT